MGAGQEDPEFKASFDYNLSSKPTLSHLRPCLKKNQANKNLAFRSLVWWPYL